MYINIGGNSMNNLTVNLMVKNVNESVQFYTEILGFTLEMCVPEEGVFNWAMVSNGGVSVMFQEESNIKEEYNCLKKNNITPSFTMYIKTDDVQQLYDGLKDKVDFVLDYHKTFYGSFEFAIRDNSGYILTFVQQ